MAEAALKIPEQFDVRSEVEASLRRGATDPYAIARRISPRLTAEQREDFVTLWLAQMARALMGQIRRSPMVVETRQDSGAVTHTLNADKFAMSRYEIAGEGWSQLRLLTAEACIKIAEAREALAAGTIREARQMRSLAAAIRKHGVGTVGELPESVLVEVLK